MTGANLEFYSYGPLCCSVCVPKEWDAERVAEEASRADDFGTKWVVCNEATFITGQANPCVCESNEARKHWLMEC